MQGILKNARNRSAAIGALLLLAAIAACGRKSNTVAPPLQVEVASVIRRDVPVTHEWVGTLDGYVNAEIRPQIEGYLLRQVYREGEVVHRGDLLFEIDSRPFRAALEQAEAALVRNQALLAKAVHDVERFEPLALQKAVSQQELDDALSAKREAEANVDAARATVDRARLSLEWTRVLSPIDGIAGIAKSQVGNLVNGQTVMTTVSTVDPIKVYFNPSEQEYMKWMERNAAGKASLELYLSDGSLYPQRGDPFLADRGVDVKTGTILVAGLFPNPDNLLRPGQYARVRAELEVRKDALLVPQRAVTELQGNYQVAVVGADNKVDIRPVKTGERVGNLWVIEQGLQADDRVVVEGTQKVAAGMLVQPMVNLAKALPVAATGAGTSALNEK